MYRSKAYRYPNELLILAVTIILVLTVIVIATTVTFCLAGVFIIIMLIMALITNRSHHQSLMQQAYQVRPDNLPELFNIAAIAYWEEWQVPDESAYNSLRVIVLPKSVPPKRC
mgnify:CR=1 FL=1